MEAMGSVFVFGTGMVLIAVVVLLRFFVVTMNTPLKRIIQVRKGDFIKAVYYIYYRLRGIDLSPVQVDALGLSQDIAYSYQHFGGPKLDKIMATLSINRNDSILDIGCGKGGAIITLSKYPFQSVDGLDINDRLLAIARTNLKKLNIGKVNLFCSNAADFTDLDIYSYIYMANPFPCNIMKNVISNINVSLKSRPRQMTIIYQNPVCHDTILVHSDFRIVMNFSQTPCKIYKNMIV